MAHVSSSKLGSRFYAIMTTTFRVGVAGQESDTFMYHPVTMLRLVELPVEPQCRFPSQVQ